MHVVQKDSPFSWHSRSSTYSWHADVAILTLAYIKTRPPRYHVTQVPIETDFSPSFLQHFTSWGMVAPRMLRCPKPLDEWRLTPKQQPLEEILWNPILRSGFQLQYFENNFAPRFLIDHAISEERLGHQMLLFPWQRYVNMARVLAVEHHIINNVMCATFRTLSI